jgi:hypothetical protein
LLGQSPPITFLAVEDREASRLFYRDDLGLDLQHEEPGVLVWDLNGIMLRMSVLLQVEPAPFTVLGWLVEDIRLHCRRLIDKGSSSSATSLSSRQNPDRRLTRRHPGGLVQGSGR